MDIVRRVRRILLAPRQEWEQISAETLTPRTLTLEYVAILAAIPAVCGLIGHLLFGVTMPGGVVRPGAGALIASALLGYILTLVGVYLFAIVLNLLAGPFGAKREFQAAFKVAAFAPTAGWIAGVFSLIPPLSILTLAGGLYSLYLLFLGVPIVLRPSEGKAVLYTIFAILALIVVYAILALLGAALTSMVMPGLQV